MPMCEQKFNVVYHGFQSGLLRESKLLGIRILQNASCNVPSKHGAVCF